MEEPIIAKKTVTKTYVIGEHEYSTLREAKIAALAVLLDDAPMTEELLVDRGADVAAILLSKGHKKRGPRKKKPMDPLAAHPTLPLLGLPVVVQEVQPAAASAPPGAVAVKLATSPPIRRNPLVPVLPGASTPNLNAIPMPEDL